ncbi:hypothetical protein EPA93_21390 [Ktedonosporobacter rubrisoli]|uniref:Phosphatidate cytidylyltransferase n=1 Tax=Ktedonosporobacter rubrisoli TaxID=2509675 RepID=A0A4P6JT31_KTERU|nr:phosphatidate cytidylyltransferase [Ktedonosporobacter rubrisoli]QBD78412.1 hypothetical protein EPA93_21390 [Ktedonosporobacter rubrisoli]
MTEADDAYVNCLQGASEKKIQSDAPGPKRTQGQSIVQRWLTAAVAIPIVLAIVWFGGWVAFAGAFLVVALGILELHNMLLHAGYRPFFWISLGLGGLFLLAGMLPQYRLLILEVGLGAAMFGTFICLFFRKQLDGAVIDWALTLTTPLYLGWPMSFLLLLRGFEPVELHFSASPWIVIPRGAWWVFLALLGVWGFDGAAFFTGLLLGRHKLAPSISPGKTWEGVAGEWYSQLSLVCCSQFGLWGFPGIWQLFWAS